MILGILLFIGGLWVAFSPGSFLALAVVFIVLLLVNGIFHIILSISNSKSLPGWGWYLAGGILEFLLGIYLWAHPAISLIMLIFLVGFWLLFRGITIIAASTDMKSSGVKGWGWLLTLGILMTILSFFVIMNPKFGAVSVVIIAACAMIFMGIAYFMLSLFLKKIKSKTLDVVDDAKENVEELKKQVMAQLDNVNPEIKDKVSQMFDQHKK